MDTYFIIINGTQQGPYPKEQLRFLGVTPETFVWRQGLSDWMPASKLPELNDIFVQSPPPYNSGYQNPYGPRNPYDQGNNFHTVQHTNWLPWAIVGTIAGTLFSCIGMIFGIIGIVNANKANRYYNEGASDYGDSANSSARTMTIISLCFAILGIIILIINGDKIASVLQSYPFT